MDNAPLAVNLLPNDPRTRAEKAARQVRAAIPGLGDLRHQLILVVGGRGAGKTLCLRMVADETGAAVTNLGLELSERLLDLTARDRPRQVARLVGQIASEGGPAILDNLEVLFAPHLKVNPLSLLRSLSRDRPIIVSWPGSTDGGRLRYAPPGHREHQVHAAGDLVLVPLDAGAANLE